MQVGKVATILFEGGAGVSRKIQTVRAFSHIFKKLKMVV